MVEQLLDYAPDRFQRVRIIAIRHSPYLGERLGWNEKRRSAAACSFALARRSQALVNAPLWWKTGFARGH